RLRAYVTRRSGDGAAPGTIRAELAALKRAFNLLDEDEVLARVPTFPKVRAADPRAGFFEDPEIERLAAELPDYLVPVLRFGAFTGWRLKEVTGLTWDRVDFSAGTIRLEGRHTKNAEAREFPFTALPELAQLLRAQLNAGTGAEFATGERSRWVFFRTTARGPRPIRDHYHAWRSACERAGVPGKLFHDLRRTAVRNLERAGVSRSVAMKLTGHKTESVYQRYAVTNAADLRAGVAKLAVLAAQATDGQQSGGSDAR
ncbi:MAG: tyrosine-type recombinase/integrase, partial [Gemmatimonadales bacterium]